jgi:hypothetical protein
MNSLGKRRKGVSISSRNYPPQGDRRCDAKCVYSRYQAGYPARNTSNGAARSGDASATILPFLAHLQWTAIPEPHARKAIPGWLCAVLIPLCGTDYSGVHAPRGPPTPDDKPPKL